MFYEKFYEEKKYLFLDQHNIQTGVKVSCFLAVGYNLKYVK